MPRLAGIALVVLVAGLPAIAGAIPYTGTLSLELGAGNGRSYPPLVITGSGTGESEGLGGAVRLTGGPGIAGVATLRGLAAMFQPVVSIDASGGITRGTFLPGGGPDGGLGAGNTPLFGFVRIGLFGPPAFAFLTLPLSGLGLEGGMVTLTNSLDVVVTAFGGGWTTGVAKVIGNATPFLGETLATTTGSDDRTVSGLGSVVFVAPTLIRTNVAGSFSPPLTARLELTFVPEPGTIVLISAGLAGLTRLGRRRQSS